MNDCKNIQPLLSEYVDGELADEAMRRVKMHVLSCAVCQSIADDFASTARLISSLPVPKGPSANFETMLARRIADQCLAPKPLSPLEKLRLWWDETTAPSAGGYRLNPALAGAFALLIVLFPTAYIMTHTQQPRSGAGLPIVQASVSAESATNLVANDPTLSELWNEHTAFSSAQTLGDPANALTGSAEN